MILKTEIEFEDKDAEKFGIETKTLLWREAVVDLKEVYAIYPAIIDGEVITDCACFVTKSGDSMGIKVPYDALVLIMERLWGKSKTWDELIKTTSKSE